MLTQIFIKDDGCQPEYTKIASQSFIFHPTGLPGIDYASELFTGGDVSLMDYTYPIWSADIRDTALDYTAGNITNTIKSGAAAMGIPIPINLVPNDTVTISGNTSFNNASLYINAGWDVSLIVGVYYFNCSEVTNNGGAKVFTFIPVSTTVFDLDAKACFNADVTLGSNFDFHDTRILVGYNIIATCPTEDCEEISLVDANVATVSYTLDIERPCQVIPNNFIIRNCCEPIITELVNIPGLVVGNFHVDDEGNCWEVMEQSNDVTNFTRTFTDIYTTCLECQDANPCPLNLAILSCCVPGIELVSGSLPGLVVGDTFVDNYGLCWNVIGETGAPISEESITVVSIIEGDCAACLTANPCPNFYRVKSCCTSISGTIAVPDVLNTGDSFVDAQGLCWNVEGPGTSLPTIYGIEVVTVYPFQGIGVVPTSCTLCTTANPCPTEYFITIRNCCNNDRIEVAQVPAAFMIFNEGLIFQDRWGICWEVMSFSTTGVETYIIADWSTAPNLATFADCNLCRGRKGGPCGLYEVKQCGSETTITVILNFTPIIGLFYSLAPPNPTVCYEIIGYGYPVIGEIYPSLNGGEPSATTCEECEFYSSNLKRVIWEYCDTPGITHVADTTLSGANNYAYLVSLTVPVGGAKKSGCIQLIGLTTDPVDSTIVGLINIYNDCPSCLGG